jgi:hypothetical protein
MATIWESVPADQVNEGDILRWGVDGRVKVDGVRDHRGYIDLHVTGPASRFERYHGLSSGKLCRPTDQVERMTPARAARVSPDNFRTVI